MTILDDMDRAYAQIRAAVEAYGDIVKHVELGGKVYRAGDDVHPMASFWFRDVTSSEPHLNIPLGPSDVVDR